MCTLLVVLFDKTGVHGKNKLQNSITTSLTKYTKTTVTVHKAKIRSDSDWKGYILTQQKLPFC
jgi:hypothetical protein